MVNDTRTPDSVIRNGTVVTPNYQEKVDIGIRNGQISQLAAPGNIEKGQKEIDATDLLVFPGFIDSHVHVNISLGEFVTRDGFKEVTRAAAHGGTTTIVDFAIPDPGESPLEAFERKLDEAENTAYVDYGLHACITDVNSRTLEELSQLIERGASSIKMFMVYEGRLRLTHGEIREVMKKVADDDGLVLIHAEDQEIIAQLVEKQIEIGETDYSVHPKTHPPVSETTAMWTIAELVKETGCPTYFVHASTKDGQNVFKYAQEQNLPLLVETCPHYLTLTTEVYQRDDGEKYVCSPPIRTEENQTALWEMVENGLIQTINSDHCGYDTEQKEEFQEDITKIPNGLPGVETKNLLFYSEGVKNRSLPLERFVELTSTNIAKMLGIYPQKGTIAVGSDADLVLYDPDIAWQLTEAALHMETDYTPFESFDIQGKPETTIVRGEPIVENGELVGDEEQGIFVETTGENATTLFKHRG